MSTGADRSAGSGYARAMADSSAGGVVTTVLSNRIGALLSAVALRWGWHPSYLSLGNVVAAGAGSAVVIASAGQAHRWWAAGWCALALWTLAYAFDCADGQLARLTGKKSEFGARVDVLADYLAQTLIAAALAVLLARTPGVPITFVAVMCSLWYFGTFATVLRRSDLEPGHALLRSRGVANVLRTLMDTGFVNLLLGAWLVLSPTTVIIPAVGFTLLNAGYLLATLGRETRSSIRVRDRG